MRVLIADDNRYRSRSAGTRFRAAQFADHPLPSFDMRVARRTARRAADPALHPIR